MKHYSLQLEEPRVPASLWSLRSPATSIPRNQNWEAMPAQGHSPARHRTARRPVIFVAMQFSFSLFLRLVSLNGVSSRNMFCDGQRLQTLSDLKASGTQDLRALIAGSMPYSISTVYKFVCVPCCWFSVVCRSFSGYSAHQLNAHKLRAMAKRHGEHLCPKSRTPRSFTSQCNEQNPSRKLTSSYETGVLKHHLSPLDQDMEKAVVQVVGTCI